jgi:hypothetical protein
MSPDPDWMALGEAQERDLFHRAARQTVLERPIVHNASVADVDAVVGKGETGCHKMGAERRLRAASEQSVGLHVARSQRKHRREKSACDRVIVSALAMTVLHPAGLVCAKLPLHRRDECPDG